MNDLTARALPHLGTQTRRWWKVELDKRSNTKPIKVTLMEPLPGTQNLYQEVGYDRAIAEPAEIGQAARRVLARVEKHALVSGDYQRPSQQNQQKVNY